MEGVARAAAHSSFVQLRCLSHRLGSGGGGGGGGGDGGGGGGDTKGGAPVTIVTAGGGRLPERPPPAAPVSPKATTTMTTIKPGPALHARRPRRAVTLATAAERISVGAAIQAINAGEWAAAEAELDVLIRANPALADAYVARGTARALQRQLAAAVPRGSGGLNPDTLYPLRAAPGSRTHQA